MERLTIISSDGEVCRTRRDISDGDAWHKLAEYEDTGLTPEEVTTLKEELDISRSEVQGLSRKLIELQADCDYWEREAKKWCANKPYKETL